MRFLSGHELLLKEKERLENELNGSLLNLKNIFLKLFVFL